MGVFVRYQKFHTFCFYCIFWKIINGLPFICNLITFTPFVLNLREHQKALIYCFPVLGRNANFSFSSSRRILIHWSYTLKRKPPPAHPPPSRSLQLQPFIYKPSYPMSSSLSATTSAESRSWTIQFHIPSPHLPKFFQHLVLAQHLYKWLMPNLGCCCFFNFYNNLISTPLQPFPPLSTS